MSFQVPDACTLPTADQPLRLAEFDALFAAAVRRVERVAPNHARMHLSGVAGLADTVTDLAARETACCAFFAFTVTPVARGGTDAARAEALTLDVQVPPRYTGVLDSLVARATAARGSAA